MGHDDSMVRDANDIKGEGQMLKMHRERDMMDEDEDGEAIEEILRAWTAPTCKFGYRNHTYTSSLFVLVVDLSVVPSGELNRNYASRAGRLQPDGDEKAKQEQRELNTLMVIYTSQSDIPPSPREPLEQDSEDFEPERFFGPPSDETKVGDHSEGWH